MANRNKRKREEPTRPKAIPIPTDVAQQAVKEKKDLLILVEGQTEEVYFKGVLRGLEKFDLENVANNIDIRLLKNGTGTKGHKTDIRNMALEAMKQKQAYEEVWLVVDNDKRNAFILGDVSGNFNVNPKEFTGLGKSQGIYDKIKDAWEYPHHNYFLSEHDYLNWLKDILGADDTIQYWSIIKNATPKNSTFEAFDKSRNRLPVTLFKNQIANKPSIAQQLDANWSDYTSLAYSSIAFEYWLLLHFEFNTTPFIWVEHSMSKDIDVFHYFTTQYRNGYGKGSTPTSSHGASIISCDAYTCLLDVPTEHDVQSWGQEEHWQAFYKIIKAYCHAKSLRARIEADPLSSSYQWYEHNPYICGLDTLIEKVLYLKDARNGQKLDYYGWEMEFAVDRATCQIMLTIEQEEGSEVLNSNHRESFRLISQEKQFFDPIELKPEAITGKTKISINIPYKEFPDDNLLIMKFKDPRGERNPKLFILLECRNS